MSETVLEIPITDFPFKEGTPFWAKVERIKDGVAHIVISTDEKIETPRKTSSLGDWARKNRGILKGVEKHAKDDSILEAIIEKHAPELLG